MFSKIVPLLLYRLQFGFGSELYSGLINFVMSTIFCYVSYEVAGFCVGNFFTR